MTDLNVILISLDAVRADHLSCYGYTRKTTPNIDALAKKGVLFEQAIAASYWTLPSHASMLSGLNSSVHGARNRLRKIGKTKLLSEFLKEKGYRTAGIVSNIFVSKAHGFDKGFDYFVDVTEGWNSAWAQDQENAKNVIDQAVDWLKKNDSEKFFLFLHLMDAHNPYCPPPAFDNFVDPDYRDKRNENIHCMLNFLRDFIKPLKEKELQHLINLYDGEIYYVDHCLGKLFDYLRQQGLTEKTLIVVTADHGEEFKDHGYFDHGSFFDEVIRVPLIFYCPRLMPQDKRKKQLVRHIDITPTILDFLDIQAEQAFQGQSLKPTILKNVDLKLTAIVECIDFIPEFTAHFLHSRCIRTDKEKYFEKSTLFKPKRLRGLSKKELTQFWTWMKVMYHQLKKHQFQIIRKEYYNLEEDPLEKENLIKSQPQAAKILKKKMDDYYQGIKHLKDPSTKRSMSPTSERQQIVQKRLESLGYID